MIPEEILVYEKEIYDLRQLLEISRALNSTLDYEYLIQAVLDMCLAQVQTLQAALFLTPEMDDNHITLASGFNWSELERDPSQYRFSLESSLIQFFETHNSSLTMNEILESIEPEESLEVLRGMGAELVVPLRVKGKVIGLVVLGEKAVGGEYPESERNFLVDLASLASIAVENARLYERATVDMMTGLKNHAYFQTRLREERERSIKRKTPISLLLTDVDYFKKFNDTYGHQAGDEVLKEVARIASLEGAKRKQDFVARYGGEEFCVVLPGMGKEYAMEIGESIRKSIEEQTVEHEGLSMKVTISIGVGTFDPAIEENVTTKELIRRADQALYACKRNGRNQLQCYIPSMEMADNH